MKSITLILLPIFSISFNIQAQTTPIPDANFEQELINSGIDTNGSTGNILDSDAATVTFLQLYGANIADLSGIEAFVNLSNLICANNQLTSLDVSQNTALANLSCGMNSLTNLNVSSNTALTFLHCSDNQITNLNVGQNLALTQLFCSGNGLFSLDISQNIDLTQLSCFDNQISNLDLTNNTALTNVGCNNNPLMNLDVSQNTALTELSCSNIQLTNLDVSNNTALSWLNCKDNQLSNLDVSNNTALFNFFCGNNQLTNIDVSQNLILTNFHCENNGLTSLDLSQNDDLEKLHCFENNIGALDISNTDVRELLAYDGGLTSLDLRNRNFTAAFILDVKTNPALSCVQVDDPQDIPSNVSSGVEPFVYFSTTCSTPIEEIGDEDKWALGDIFPNPSGNEVVSINYLSPENTEMNIFITDMAGKQVQAWQAAISVGSHNLELDLTRLQIGMYIIQFQTDATSMTRKITVQ